MHRYPTDLSVEHRRPIRKDLEKGAVDVVLECDANRHRGVMRGSTRRSSRQRPDARGRSYHTGERMNLDAVRPALTDYMYAHTAEDSSLQVFDEWI